MALAGLLLFATVAAVAQPTGTPMVMYSADSLSWSPLELPEFAPGTEIAVLNGNPAGSGQYTVRLRFPDGYLFPAHWHPMDEHLTVVSGTFLLGMGDRFNSLDDVRVYHPGDFLVAPARMPHYGGARGVTVIQLHGEGPFGTTTVDPYVPGQRP
jgi:quercetin dioxygenase-like cupin family protein